MIISAPGVVKKETAEIADFRWNLSEPYNISTFDSTFYIFKGYPGTDPLILQFILGLCFTFNYTSLDCITDGKQIGFNITNISDNNASVYSLAIYNITSFTFASNSEAILYIYSKYIPLFRQPTIQAIEIPNQ